MSTIRTLASQLPLSWLLVPGLLLAMVMAFAITAAAASGDEFGDSAAQAGGVDGVLDDVLGAPDGTVVQIGTEGSGGDGSVTVNFDNNVAFDGPGADIRVHVIDADSPATATIEVSADGVTWVSAGDFPDTANIDIDLGALSSPLPFAVAVRVTQVSGVLPGFDLDAVEALNEVDLDDALLDGGARRRRQPRLHDAHHHRHAHRAWRGDRRRPGRLPRRDGAKRRRRRRQRHRRRRDGQL